MYPHPERGHTHGLRENALEPSSPSHEYLRRCLDELEFRVPLRGSAHTRRRGWKRLVVPGQVPRLLSCPGKFPRCIIHARSSHEPRSLGTRHEPHHRSPSCKSHLRRAEAAGTLAKGVVRCAALAAPRLAAAVEALMVGVARKAAWNAFELAAALGNFTMGLVRWLETPGRRRSK